MPSNATASLRLNKQETGSNLNTWGELLNSGVFDLLDTAVAGVSTIALSGALPYTLTSRNFVADEARSAALKFTGTGSFTVVLPGSPKGYVIRNACTGTVTLTLGGGDTVVIDAGDVVTVYSDGLGVWQLGYGGLSLKAFISASVLAATGSLPATIGNEGKALFVTSGVWAPRYAASTDLSDYATAILGRQVALATAL